MTKIIVFAGRKQSGKSTSSRFVSDLYWDKKTRIYSFADPLKEICMNLFGLSHAQCYGTDEDKNQLTNTSHPQTGQPLTGRELMQILGTDMMRALQPDVWVNGVISKIRQDNPDVAIIEDSRFGNECDGMKRVGGIIIKLTRNLYNSTHASETALDPEHYDPNNFDLVIDNTRMSIAEQNFIVQGFLEQRNLI
jgi:hypothetical protein